MNFNPHYNLAGKHAFLSASNYHWLNYDEDKIRTTYANHRAAQRGTELHDLAARCINLGVKLPRTKSTLNLYVNDGIHYHMTTEQPLYYSEFAFGTADAISFKKNILRIHDLKTGESKTSFLQLEIYAALFCLEYGVNPEDISLIELHIYQYDDVAVEIANPEDIRAIMNKIIEFDAIIERMEMGDMYG